MVPTYNLIDVRVLAIVYGVLAVLGLLMNALLIIMYKRRQLELPFSYYILMLGMTNFLVCLVVTPYSIMYEYHVLQDSVVCMLLEYFRHALVHISNIFLCATALHCYYCIERVQIPGDMKQFWNAFEITLTLSVIIALPCIALYMAAEHDGMTSSESQFIKSFINSYSEIGPSYCRFSATLVGLTWALAYQGIMLIEFIIIFSIITVLFSLSIIRFRRRQRNEGDGFSLLESPYINGMDGREMKAKFVLRSCAMVFGSAIFTMFCWIPVWIELLTRLQLLFLKYCFLIPPALTPLLYFIFNKQFRHVTAQYLPFLSRFSSASRDSLTSLEEGSETAQLQKDEDAQIMRELAEKKRLERESADKLKEEAIRQLQKREQARLLELLEIERQEKEKAMQKENVMQKEKATQEEKKKDLEEKAKVMRAQLWQDNTELQKVAHDSLQKSDNDPERKPVREGQEPDKQGHYEIPGSVEKEPESTMRSVCDLGTSEPCISGEGARVPKENGDNYESLNREDSEYVDTKRKPDKIDKDLTREEACEGSKEDDYYFFDWVATPKVNAEPELQAISLEPDEGKIPRTAMRTMQIQCDLIQDPEKSRGSEVKNENGEQNNREERARKGGELEVHPEEQSLYIFQGLNLRKVESCDDHEFTQKVEEYSKKYEYKISQKKFPKQLDEAMMARRAQEELEIQQLKDRREKERREREEEPKDKEERERREREERDKEREELKRMEREAMKLMKKEDQERLDREEQERKKKEEEEMKEKEEQERLEKEEQERKEKEERDRIEREEQLAKQKQPKEHSLLIVQETNLKKIKNYTQEPFNETTEEISKILEYKINKNNFSTKPEQQTMPAGLDEVTDDLENERQRREEELKEKEEKERRERDEQERKDREEQERKDREEQERKDREEQERKDREEQERKDMEEQERKEREEQECKEKEDRERKEREEIKRMEREALVLMEREVQERREREEKDLMEKEEQERKEREEQEIKEREEQERREQEEQELKEREKQIAMEPVQHVPGSSGQNRGPTRQKSFQIDMIEQSYEPNTLNTTHYHTLLEKFYEEGRRRKTLEVSLEMQRQRVLDPGEGSKPLSPRNMTPEVICLEDMLAECTRRLQQLKALLDMEMARQLPSSSPDHLNNPSDLTDKPLEERQQDLKNTEDQQVKVGKQPHKEKQLQAPRDNEERHRKEKEEKQRKEREEKDQKEREKRERKEKEKKERIEKEEKERKEKEEKERKEKEEKERKEREEKERKEREKKERKEKEEKERKEREEKERKEREEKERKERAKKERKEKEEKERKEKEEKARKEREEKERKEREQQERKKREALEIKEREELKRLEREELKRLEQELKDREEQELKEREEKERLEREEMERLEREKQEPMEKVEPLPGSSGQYVGPRRQASFQLDMFEQNLENDSITTTHYHSLLEMFHEEGRRQETLEDKLERHRQQTQDFEGSKLLSPRCMPPDTSRLEEMLADCKKRQHQLMAQMRNFAEDRQYVDTAAQVSDLEHKCEGPLSTQLGEQRKQKMEKGMDTHKHKDEEHLPVDTELSDLERYQRESLLSAQKAYFSDQMKQNLETEEKEQERKDRDLKHLGKHNTERKQNE